MFTKSFKQLTKKDILAAGGKGASLGEMVNNKIPVPPGFVVLAKAFDRFLEETDLTQDIEARLNEINYNDTHSVDRASNVIRDLICDAKMPRDLEKEIVSEFLNLKTQRLKFKTAEPKGQFFTAVRSSATAEDSEVASWAGELESYLNTTRETLLENVKKCWSSLFTSRAIFYRREKDLLKANVSVAVVIQEMIASEISGIVFTVHPVTQDKNQMIIEAGWGLGEAIVSGSITPDAYVIDKRDWSMIDINITEQKKQITKCLRKGVRWAPVAKSQQEKQKLTGKQIIELAEICLRIEKHYKKPQDIEWAYADGKFYIVQSRPITTLKTTKPRKNENAEKDYELHFTVSGFSILFLDMIFNNNETYGAADHVVLYENDVTRAYLSPKGAKECYKISTSLLNDDFYHKFLVESKKLDKDLKFYSLDHLDEKNLNEEWKKSMLLNDKFCELYRFYEQPFQQALEQEILKTISKERLIEILTHNSFDKLPDAKTKKYVERLIEMGKMKLRLHGDSEKFFTDDIFLKYVSRKHNLPMEIVGAMRVSEFEKALHGELTITIDELKERLKGSVFVKENNEWNLYTGEQYAYWKDKMQRIHNSEVIGDVAFSGIAKGRVVTHLSWTNTTNVRNGDVLVTGMTNPQMIPLLKKASAIVTDEGGIICHAAIVSRELRKPCIVGTKNATQVLEDGDLVEVNANEGFVRIIEKSKK